MLSSVLILKNCKYCNSNKEALLFFDFKDLTVTFMLNGEKLGFETFENWDQMFVAFKWFACKEEWIFYEV